VTYRNCECFQSRNICVNFIDDGEHTNYDITKKLTSKNLTSSFTVLELLPSEKNRSKLLQITYTLVLIFLEQMHSIVLDYMRIIWKLAIA